MNAEVAEANALAEGVHAKAGAASDAVGRDAAQVVPAYAWYVLVLLASTYMLASLDRSAISVVVEPIRTEFSLNDSQLGVLVGFAFGIPYAIAGIPFGMVIDRVHRRNFLSGILALWSMLTALGGFTVNFTQLLLSRMAAGTAEGGLAAAHSMLTDYFPAAKRPMALGFLASGGTVAYILTFALGGWVAQHWGWRYVFFVVGVPGLVMALVIFLTVREPTRGAMEKKPNADVEPAPPLFVTLRYLFSIPTFRNLYIGYAFGGATVSGFWSWISSLLIRVQGLTMQQAGLYIAFCAGIGACFGTMGGATIAGHLAKRGVKSVVTFFAVIAGAAAPLGMVMTFAPSLGVVLASMAVVACFKNSYFGPITGVLLTIAKIRMRGVTSSLMIVTGTLIGFGAGPFIVGTVSNLLGGGTAIRYGFAVMFILDAFAGAYLWRALRTLEVDLKSVGVELPRAA